MRKLFLLLLLCASRLAATTYTSSFTGTNNPLPSPWVGGGSTGLDWANCQNTPGFAFGTQVQGGPSVFNDSTCIVSGSWGASQTVQLTVHIAVPVANNGNTNAEEVELRLRTTIASHSITGYEVNCSVIPGNSYLQLVRWNGALGNFTLLTASAVPCVEGDVLKATISGLGTATVVTAFKNNVQQFTWTDTGCSAAWCSQPGFPGMGFFIQNSPAANSNFGASSFTADDGGGGGGGGTNLWDSIIDPSRAIDWTTAGVIGGIPSAGFAQCGSTLTAASFGGTSSAPVSAGPINTVINGCGANTYVLLGPGYFYLNSGITNKTGVVVRGSGADSTFLYFSGISACDGQGAAICIQGQNIFPASSLVNTQTAPQSLTITGIPSPTSITVTNVGSAGVSVGTYLYVDQENELVPFNGFMTCDQNTTPPACSGEAMTASQVRGFAGRPLRSLMQAVRVTAVSGCTSPCSGAGPFTFTITPLYGTQWSTSKNPGAYWATSMLNNSGLENLSIDEGSATGEFTIELHNAVNVWVQGVRSIKGKIHISLFNVAHSTIQNNYFYDTRNATTVSYGVELFGNSDNLIAQNICQHINACIIMGPSNGDVQVYNFGYDNYINQSPNNSPVTNTSANGSFITYTFTGTAPTNGTIVSVGGTLNGGQGNLNVTNGLVTNVTANTFQVASTKVQASAAEPNAIAWYSNGTLFKSGWPGHDAGIIYNLWEGNTGAGVVADNFHGSSNTSTFYRNWLVGFERNKSGQRWAVDNHAYNRYPNFVANVLGDQIYHTVYQEYVGCVSGCTGTSQPVYSLFFGLVEGSVTVNDDPFGLTTAMRYGNYDVVTGTRFCGNSANTGWTTTCLVNGVSTSEVPTGLASYANAVPTKGDTAKGQAAFPPSFAFATKPTWYTSTFATVPWPTIGPDITGGTAIAPDLFDTTVAPAGHAYANPAQLCYLNSPIDLTNYPAGMDRGVLLFNANNCYVGGGPVVPNAPTGLTATVAGSNVNLAWVLPTGTLTNVKVYRSTVHGGPYSLISTLAGTATTFVDTPGSGTFFYVVTASNSAGESARSNEASATVGGAITATLLPASLTYAAQLVGTSSTTQNVTLTNTSGAGINVTIGSITLGGANPGDFSQVTTHSSTLTWAASTTAGVTSYNIYRAPCTGTIIGTSCSAEGTFAKIGSTAGLTFTDNTASGPVSYYITSVCPTCSPTEGPPSNHIAANVFLPCTGTLASGASCVITVTFTPTAAGTRTANLQVTDNSTTSPHIVTLTGTGTSAVAGISLSPASTNFGSQAVSTTSTTHTVILTSTGTGTLNITSISLTGTNSADFGESTTCGATLAPGLSCNINLTFTPSATGLRTASVSVADSAAGSPHTAALQGTGITVKCVITGTSTMSGITITCGP